MSKLHDNINLNKDGENAVKHIIKNFFQKVVRHVKQLSLQSAETEIDANMQQRHVERFFTINTHCLVNKEFLINEGEERQFFWNQVVQGIAMVRANSFGVIQTYYSKYMQITPKKDLIQSYSIMVGGVLT